MRRSPQRMVITTNLKQMTCRNALDSQCLALIKVQARRAGRSNNSKPIRNHSLSHHQHLNPLKTLVSKNIHSPTKTIPQLRICPSKRPPKKFSRDLTRREINRSTPLTEHTR